MPFSAYRQMTILLSQFSPSVVSQSPSVSVTPEIYSKMVLKWVKTCLYHTIV